MNAVDQLALGDVTKYDAVFDLPNSQVFLKRLMNRHSAAFSKAHADILRRQNAPDK